jgi:hypothetical protein
LAPVAFHLQVQITFGGLAVKVAIYKEVVLCSFLPQEEVQEAVIPALQREPAVMEEVGHLVAGLVVIPETEAQSPVAVPVTVALAQKLTMELIIAFTPAAPEAVWVF